MPQAELVTRDESRIVQFDIAPWLAIADKKLLNDLEDVRKKYYDDDIWANWCLDEAGYLARKYNPIIDEAITYCEASPTEYFNISVNALACRRWLNKNRKGWNNEQSH